MRALCLTLCALLLAVRAEVDPIPRALERVNAHRKAAGLEPVALDPALSKGCRLHAEYLVLNRDAPQVQGLGGHKEDPKLPGYTPEGARAGMASDIGFQPPLECVEMWVNSLFHRIPLLDPNLKRVGFACASGGGGTVSVLDLTGGNPSVGTSSMVVLYPADGQTDVPCRFLRYELPDPIPEDKDLVAGYVITASFKLALPVKGAKARLKDAKGREVDCWVSTPEKPAHPAYQRNTIGLIAKDPLKPGTAYTVEMSARVGGKPWERAWTFTTSS